jgi:predicted RNA binding protein YcfA (HicA-like mRNA interferase family)
MARRIIGGDSRSGPKKASQARPTVSWVKVRAIIRLIEADGWQQVRQAGSHRHFRHPTKPGTVTVAGHLRDELHPKTKASIMRQAGLRQ